ncbi:MAG: peptide deformylase [Syntrophales bacterium]
MSKTRIWTLWSEKGINEEESKILRSHAREIPVPYDDEARRDIKKLLDAFLERDDALGLAAPQIGICKKIVVFKIRGLNEKAPVRSENDYEVLINPRITQKRGEEEKMSEGCLSCPDINVEVTRPREIKVRAHDMKGNRINKRYTDFLARIVQHELDHLDGKLIIDHDGTFFIPREKRDFFRKLFVSDSPDAQKKMAHT